MTTSHSDLNVVRDEHFSVLNWSGKSHCEITQQIEKKSDLISVYVHAIRKTLFFLTPKGYLALEVVSQGSG